MAKILTDDEGVIHLRGLGEQTLCGDVPDKFIVLDGTLTCPICAEIALRAIELTTKAERRIWRTL